VRGMACNNALIVHSDSSLLVYIDKECHEAKEIRSRFNDKQFFNNAHTFQRWKQCNHPNHCVSYRTQGMRPLLVDYLEHGSHNLSRLWEHDNTTTAFDTFQGRRNMSISCKYCGNSIVFDDNMRSKTGKKVPLNERDHKYHDCKFSPYNKTKATAVEKREIMKIDEFQTIEDLRNKVAATNNRLEHYEVKLIVEYKE
jgi:hypothetical protein